MWTKTQKTLVGIAAVVAVVLFGFGYWSSTKAAGFVPPPPTQLAVWLPVDVAAAEVSLSRVGSLLVTLPLEEFKKRFPTGGLVSFPSRDVKTRLGVNPSGVTAWHIEGGVIYRVEQDIKHPDSWPSVFTIGTLRLEGGAIVAYPENYGAISFYIPAISSAGIALIGAVVFSLQGRPDNPVVRPT